MFKSFFEVILTGLTLIAAGLAIAALTNFVGMWGSGLDNILYDAMGRLR